MAEQLVPILRVADGHASAAWYQRLGFEVAGEHRFAPDLPLYLFLARGDVALHLSEHTGDAPKGGVVYLYVDDIASVASEFDASISEKPWADEVEITDPDGNRIRVGQRRA